MTSGDPGADRRPLPPDREPAEPAYGGAGGIPDLAGGGDRAFDPELAAAPAPPPAPDPASDARQPGAQRFADRVLVFFGSQVATAALGVFNGIFLARLIGPTGKGDYYLLTFLPPTLMVLTQLGLPQAFGFFAARGQMGTLIRRSVTLTIAISGPVLAAAILLLPVLRSSLFNGLDDASIVLPLLALPFLLNATLTTGIVVGRQAARWLAGVGIAYSVLATVLILVLAGVLGLGVWGALIAFLAAAIFQAAGFLVAAGRVSRATVSEGTTRTAAFFRYGLPFYPGSLTQFFSYRADVYLLALLLADPFTALGYYSLAVSIAELVFFFPNAVAAFFFPHVAGASRADADRQVGQVSRVTLLMTAVVGVALVPVAALGINVVLPAFGPSLPALYVLLPGVVAISVSKVLSGYVSGLGLTGWTSAVTILAFVVNLVLNVVLIPRFGIVGASAASLISYTLSSVAFSVLAGRLAGVRPTAFWAIGGSDVRYATTVVIGLARRVSARWRPAD